VAAEPAAASVPFRSLLLSSIPSARTRPSCWPRPYPPRLALEGYGRAAVSGSRRLAAGAHRLSRKDGTCAPPPRTLVVAAPFPSALLGIGLGHRGFASVANAA